MKKMIRLATAGAVLAAAASLNTAAFAASDDATANANILSALTVTEQTQLNFGSVAVNSAGTVVVASDGSAIQCNAGVVCGGGDARGAFLVTGAPSTNILASVRETTIQLSHTTTPANKMTLDTFTVTAPTALSAAGNATVNVGGTLHVAAAQAPGLYQGTYNLDVLYN